MEVLGISDEAATLGISDEVRGKMGRWKSSMSTVEGYSRQDKSIIYKAQAQTASFIREQRSAASVEDIFGERSIIDLMRARLVEEGCTPDDIYWTVTNLTYFGAAVAVAQDPALGEEGVLEDDYGDADDFGDNDAPLPSIDAMSEVEQEVLTASEDTAFEDRTLAVQVVAVDSDDDMYDECLEVPDPLDYVTCRSERSGARRLHRVGWCWRTPNIDYKVWEIFKDVPAQTSYDVICKQCWKHHGDYVPGHYSTNSPSGSSLQHDDDASSTTSSSSQAEEDG